MSQSEYKIKHYPGEKTPWYVKDKNGLDYGRFDTQSEADKYRHKLLGEMHSLVPLSNNQTSQGTEVEENTMNANIQAVASQRPYSVESDRVDHFIKVRLPRMAMAKTNELEQHFGLVDDPAPKSFKELMERIEKKHFVINEEREASNEAGFGWGCPLDAIRFRDPEKVEDRKGYLEAVKAMHEGMRATEDEIVAYQNDGEKVLAALAKFEANTYH